MDMMFCDRFKAHCFREVLPHKAIGVFTQPPFPGMIGMGEIHRRLQLLSDRIMVCEFLAVSSNNSAHLSLIGLR